MSQPEFRDLVTRILGTPQGESFLNKFKVKQDPVTVLRKKIVVELVVPSGYESKIKSVEVLINAIKSEKEIPMILGVLERYHLPPSHILSSSESK